MMSRALAAFAALLALAAVAWSPARADKKTPERKIYLNGVDISSLELPEAAFKHCTVAFDARGNIRITVPGHEFAAKPVDSGKGSGSSSARSEPPAKLSRNYFLIASEDGTSGYDVDVLINGDKVTRVRSNGTPLVMDVTKWVEPGHNRLELLAHKRRSKSGSGSAKHQLEIQLAEGDLEGQQAIVRKPLLTYRRTAAETASFRDAYNFSGR